MTTLRTEAATLLPRELASGVYWLGDCYRTKVGDMWNHSYHAVYVVSGTDASIVVDTGSAKDWSVVDRQLDELAGRIASVRYILPSHPEVAHAANLGRMCRKFPEAVVCGYTHDYHLIFPELVDRLVGTKEGDELDLGGRTFTFLEAIFRDIFPTQWGYDDVSRALFTGDGFAYKHYHAVGECGKYAEEIPDLPLPELTAMFSEAAFYWTRFCDIEPIIARLEELFATREIDIVAPAHGCPIVDPVASVPKVMDGLRLGQQVDRETIARRLTALRG